MRQRNPLKEEPEFAVWQNMKRKKLPITERWSDNYRQFKVDVGSKPSSSAILKRKNLNYGYFPNNVFWYDRDMNKLPELPKDATTKDRIEQLRKYGLSIGRLIQVEDQVEKAEEDPFGQELDFTEPAH